ncbi:hypothetical protein [Virgibacillus salexigens]|uniref:hypothetical protein n=1 Tax=Virgibacillus salexigens TaxID=61016 RepID=UPI00190C4B43|nr:hypothetical protein [Virgibacillus salexigens]
MGDDGKFMRKRTLFTLIVVSVLLVLSACGGTDSAAEDKIDEINETPKTGLNETTIDEVIAKKDDNKAFYVLMYDAKKKYVKNTKLLEVYDKALKDKDMPAFYLNLNTLDDEKKQKVEAVSESYSNRTSGHNPFEDGGMAVVHGGQFNSAYAYQGSAWILNTLIGKANTENNTFRDEGLYSKVEKEIQFNIDYINEENVELTY